jgi:hypothetical protein
VATSPFLGAERFPILQFNDQDVECIALGARQPLFDLGVNYAHPDSEHSPILTAAGRKLERTAFEVSPTASGRTVLVRPPFPPSYIKLTYDTSRLGRVDRQLSLKLCQSSLEVTTTLKRCLDDGLLPRSFSLLLETSAKVSRLGTSEGIYEWGVIYREAQPYPYSDRRTQLVPGFSLFGVDRRNVDDELLINQFIELSNAKPLDYLVNLLTMIIDCYWGVVLNCAFYPETQAQNCLFQVDENFNIVRCVLIDMQSVDKDIPLARTLGLNDTWASYPEACLDESVYYYRIRSSYIYDFKVGEYLLSPIIKAVATKYHLEVAGIEREIRDYVQSRYTSKLPADFFPSDGCWYDCDATERLPGQRRQYFAHKEPKFR